jgi:hypothetical protein
MKNKKADERVLSIYLFIIYIIVGIGIVSGVLLFYGKPFDVRELEAGILGDKVIDCLVEQGELKPDVLTVWTNLSECNFDFEDKSSTYEGSEEYYVDVKISNLDKTSVKKEFSKGNNEIFQYCGLKGEKDFVRCVKNEIYILNDNGGNKEGVLLSITSVVGKAK